MPKSELELPELDILIKEIKQGQRILLFPPGSLLAIFIIVATIIELADIISISTNLLTPFFETSTLSITQFASSFLILPCVVIPGIMLTRGHRAYRKLLRATIGLVCLGYTLLAIYFLLNETAKKAMHLLIFASMGMGVLYLTYSPKFVLFYEFYYRLKKME